VWVEKTPTPTFVHILDNYWPICKISSAVNFTIKCPTTAKPCHFTTCEMLLFKNFTDQQCGHKSSTQIFIITQRLVKFTYFYTSSVMSERSSSLFLFQQDGARTQWDCAAAICRRPTSWEPWSDHQLSRLKPNGLWEWLQECIYHEPICDLEKVKHWFGEHVGGWCETRLLNSGSDGCRRAEEWYFGHLLS